MDNIQKSKDKVTTITVGLKKYQVDRLDQIADELQVNRTAIIRFAMIWSITHPPSDSLDKNDQKHSHEELSTFSYGVNLKISEKQIIEDMANRIKLSRNRYMKLAVDRFLFDLDDKTLNLFDYLYVPIVKNTLQMPEY